MKNILLIIVFNLIIITLIYSQGKISKNQLTENIYDLINRYAQARESQDTILLKSILTPDCDQLVSTGEWRIGVEASIRGMMQSSTSKSGTRTLKIDKIRFIKSNIAIVEARYEIENTDYSIRKMWSTFIVVYQEKSWQITAIRNMLPAP